MLKTLPIGCNKYPNAGAVYPEGDPRAGENIPGVNPPIVLSAPKPPQPSVRFQVGYFALFDKDGNFVNNAWSPSGNASL